MTHYIDNENLEDFVKKEEWKKIECHFVDLCKGKFSFSFTFENKQFNYFGGKSSYEDAYNLELYAKMTLQQLVDLEKN